MQDFFFLLYCFNVQSLVSQTKLLFSCVHFTSLHCCLSFLFTLVYHSNAFLIQKIEFENKTRERLRRLQDLFLLSENILNWMKRTRKSNKQETQNERTCKLNRNTRVDFLQLLKRLSFSSSSLSSSSSSSFTIIVSSFWIQWLTLISSRFSSTTKYVGDRFD